MSGRGYVYKREPLVFELSRPGRKAYSLPSLDVPERPMGDLIPENQRRSTPANLPEVSEVDVTRHFTRLSQRNHGVDIGFYPLGSCTMKYNPKVDEAVAQYDGFASVHPYTPEELVQGALRLMFEMQGYLCEIGGFDAVTLQPAAGAHGEFTGLSIIRAYLRDKGQGRRNKVIIPDSAHGTNPATAILAGGETVEVKSDARGGVDLESLQAVVGEDTMCLMLTNPNTLGLFDENIHKAAGIVHEAGGLLYYDGANVNAIMGYARPGDAGFDVCHFNLHKTFATPHGGGGPGSGPVGVKKELADFLPVPIVRKQGDRYYLDYSVPKTIGRVKEFFGNFGVVVKAYAYIRSMGPDGLKRVSEDAVLNANFLMHRLKKDYYLMYDRICKHEFVASGLWQKERHGVKTLDIAKRLLDYGVHAPTVYFPLIVPEALMVEPTETESRETLEMFAEIMAKIAREAETSPEVVLQAPKTTFVRRLDEARAARQTDLAYREAQETE
ncbi:MAG: glycine dehydrogenase subunit 2 [Bacillota bacterium]|nr:MAG: glycine dehydrogenase subunit 2 [Bacillota bacterium]